MELGASPPFIDFKRSRGLKKKVSIFDVRTMPGIWLRTCGAEVHGLKTANIDSCW